MAVRGYFPATRSLKNDKIKFVDCIFCKIANKEIPTELLYEDTEVVAFPDIHPLAPAHILVIPKRHITSINDAQESDQLLLGKMILVAKNLAKGLNISEGGYKLLFRTGKHGGQEVPHIHLHLIGGAELYEEIKPV